jgi:hypothetical protein
MAKATAIYVSPGFSRWRVKEEGMERAMADFSSKDEAIDYARSFARTKSHSRVVVLNETGAIESEESFAVAAK